MDKISKYALFGQCIALHRNAEDNFYAIGKLIDQIPNVIDNEGDDKFLELLTSIYAELECLEKLTLSEYRERISVAISDLINRDQYPLQDPTSDNTADRTEEK